MECEVLENRNFEGNIVHRSVSGVCSPTPGISRAGRIGVTTDDLPRVRRPRVSKTIIPVVSYEGREESSRVPARQR